MSASFSTMTFCCLGKKGTEPSLAAVASGLSLEMGSSLM